MTTTTMIAGHARWVALMLCASVAACGGGGSETASPAPGSAPAPTPAPAPASAPTPAPAPAGSAGSTCGIADFQATILVRINQLRAAVANCRTGGTFGAAAPLTWNTQLTQAAEAHSQDMVAHNSFSHAGSDGSTLANRIDATGYTWSSIGENIAAGYPTIDAVMTGWMASDGHCANIMNPSFNQVGLVCVPGTSSTTYNTYWTMDLAKSR